MTEPNVIPRRRIWRDAGTRPNRSVLAQPSVVVRILLANLDPSAKRAARMATTRRVTCLDSRACGADRPRPCVHVTRRRGHEAPTRWARMSRVTAASVARTLVGVRASRSWASSRRSAGSSCSGRVAVSLVAIVLDFGSTSTRPCCSSSRPPAILGLAWVVGLSTERLGSLTGPQVGGILNATFGNIAELIIAFFALQAGLIEVVKASITGSIIGNLLLVLGASVLFGGLRHGTQTFSQRIAGSNAALLVVAVIGLFVPAVFAFIERPRPGHADRGVGPGLDRPDRRLRAVARLPVHEPGRDARRPRRAGRPRRPGVEPRRRGHRAAASRPCCSRSCPRSSSARSTASSRRSGCTPFFVGVVLIPTIGNLAEHLVAVQLAATRTRWSSRWP